MHCLLIGNFGVGNLGDEALKDYILQEFSDIEWIIVSEAPVESNEVSRLPAGIRSFFGFRWIRTLKEFASCDAVVFGGGSLFTDAESAFACLLWWMHAVCARCFRKHVHLAFQGIGPFRSRLGEWCARSVIAMSPSISVRDPDSLSRVKTLVKSKKCVLSFDPVFYLYKNKKIHSSTKNVLVLIPRNNSGSKFISEVQKEIDATTYDRVVILSMKPSDESEQEFCQKLATISQSNSRIEMVSDIDKLLLEISSASFVISERYHGALAAIALGKELTIVAQCEGDKLSSLTAMPNDPLASVEAGRTTLQEALYV